MTAACLRIRSIRRMSLFVVGLRCGQILKCVDDRSAFLTLGKEYEVLGVRNGGVVVRNDEGRMRAYSPKRFTTKPTSRLKLVVKSAYWLAIRTSRSIGWSFLPVVFTIAYVPLSLLTIFTNRYEYLLVGFALMVGTWAIGSRGRAKAIPLFGAAAVGVLFVLLAHSPWWYGEGIDFKVTLQELGSMAIFLPDRSAVGPDSRVYFEAPFLGIVVDEAGLPTRLKVTGEAVVTEWAYGSQEDGSGGPMVECDPIRGCLRCEVQTGTAGNGGKGWKGWPDDFQGFASADAPLTTAFQSLLAHQVGSLDLEIRAGPALILPVAPARLRLLFMPRVFWTDAAMVQQRQTLERQVGLFLAQESYGEVNAFRFHVESTEQQEAPVSLFLESELLLVVGTHCVLSIDGQPVQEMTNGFVAVVRRTTDTPQYLEADELLVSVFNGFRMNDAFPLFRVAGVLDNEEKLSLHFRDSSGEFLINGERHMLTPLDTLAIVALLSELDGFSESGAVEPIAELEGECTLALLNGEPTGLRRDWDRIPTSFQTMILASITGLFVLAARTALGRRS